MVYKRWKGKKIKPGDPNFDKARWWIEYRLQGRRVHKAVPEARTKAQAERAEISEREANYNRRYNKGSDIGLTTYCDEFYLPWLLERKRSQVLDAESRVKKLKAFLAIALSGKSPGAMLSVFNRHFETRKRNDKPRAKARRSIAISTFCRQSFREQPLTRWSTSTHAAGATWK
jgi:hypothetical protein